MEIIMIAAMAKNRTIGLENAIPWHIKEDFKHFNDVTSGNPVIMGRKTFESINKKPLPNRENIVITRQNIDNVKCFTSIDDALDYCKNKNNKKAFLIGGAKIYQDGLNLADKVILTIIDKDFEGDVQFPEIDNSKWKITEREQHFSEENNFFYSFNTFERI